MVYLYPGGLKIVRKSGIGQAVLHQKEALKAVGIEAGFFPAPDTQIVHINTVFPGALLAAIRARRQKKKVIYYAHSTMEDFRCSFKGSNFLAPLFKRWIMLCYRQGDAVITPTEYSKNILCNYGLTVPIYSISNGIDTDYFQPDQKRREAFRRKYRLGEQDKAVISAGHMMERKGILEYTELAREMPDVHFFWFGYTSPALMTENVRNAVKNAPENLKFPGYVEQEQLREAYCGADVFAFSSREETEGIVVLEALACEIPVVVRDIPVYEGWLRNGENVYKAESAEDFKETVREILDGTLPDVSAAGRKTAESRSLKIIGTKLMQLYRDVLKHADLSYGGQV